VIGLDSNILLRAILNDDPVQSPSARAIVEKLSADDPGYVNLVVLAEVAWSLRRWNKAKPREVAAVISALLKSPAYAVEQRMLVAAAVEVVKRGDCGFNDALIGVLNRHAGCIGTVTFDTGAPLEAGFAIYRPQGA
jgi:predicted nucleic-acid-binding protein